MIFLFETELKNKRIDLAFQSIFGLGIKNTSLVFKKLGFSENLKVENLSKKQISILVKKISSLNILLANELIKFQVLNFNKLMSIKAIKGYRKSLGLPIRGQRTHTNGKTAKKMKFLNIK